MSVQNPSPKSKQIQVIQPGRQSKIKKQDDLSFDYEEAFASNKISLRIESIKFFFYTVLKWTHCRVYSKNYQMNQALVIVIFHHHRIGFEITFVYLGMQCYHTWKKEAFLLFGRQKCLYLVNTSSIKVSRSLCRFYSCSCRVFSKG